MRYALLLLLAACGGEKKTRADRTGSGSAPPVQAISAQLVGCSAALAAPADPREAIAGAAGAPGTRSYGPPPRIELEPPHVAGALDPAVVRRVLRQHVAKLQYCFEKQLVANPGLAGGVVETAFAIQSSGAVAAPRADGVDPEVEKCFTRALESATFPPPRDGNQVQVTAPIEIKYTPPAIPRAPRPVRVNREWTPFAVEEPAPEVVARPVIDAITATARERLPAIEQCFDGARGAIRAMIAVDPSALVKLRVGGIGDSAIESCIANALGGMTVAPQARTVEVACDFTRGGDAPLRVSPDAGYTVVELTAKEIRNRSSVRDIPPRGAPRTVTSIGTITAVLIVAEPDAPGYGLEHALWWAPAGTTLVAVKASGGAPVFVGMGDSRAQRVATDQRVVQLRTDNGRLRACIPGVELPESAPLLDPRSMDRVVQAAAAACKQAPCEPTIVVGTSGDFIAKDLVATTSAARRAGFQSISIGGPACDP